MKSIFNISLIAITLFLAVSCCNVCRKGSPKIGELENTPWVLIELNEKGIQKYNITLIFDAPKKMISGKAPCNSYFGGYSLFEDETNNIKITNVGSTMRFCEDADVEEEFMTSLATITNLKMDGEHLLMLDSEGKLVMICIPQPKEE